MTYDYADEKLWGAIRTLEAGQSPIRERLESACENHVIKLKSSDLPTNLRSRFKELHDRLTTHVSYHESIINMGDEEACKIEDEILKLYTDLQIIRQRPH